MTPVLLVHGFLETGRRFTRMADALRADGRDAHVFSYQPNDGTVGIDQTAEQLARFADETVGPNEPFDLIGYSMGGLVSRYYIQRLGGVERVRRLVTLASPHRGTAIAYLAKKPAVRQMRFGSEFLAALNADTAWTRRVEWTSLWTPFDLMIVPASSSRISPALDRRLWVLLHPWMITSRRSIRLVRELLRVPSAVTSE